MQSIARAFQKMCQQKYYLLGFRREQQFFGRILGDVIQAFRLKKRTGLNVYTVEFGIYPYCAPTPIYLDAGQYDLEGFFPERLADGAGWKIQPESAQTIKDSIESIGVAMDKYLIPLFCRCCDCASALTELMTLEDVFEKNRTEALKILEELDGTDCSSYKSRLYRPHYYYMALKAHAYEYINRFLQHQINHHTISLQKFDLPGATIQPAIVRERYAQNLAFYQEHRQHLETDNFDFFERFVHANEKEMLSYLLNNYPNLVK